MAKVDYTFKILMLGSASTGKTTLSNRFITGIFNPDIKLTVGVDFYVKALTVNGKKIKLQIWDMGGENRFRFLLPTYCLGSSGAIFLYDITRTDTIAKIQDWTNIVKEKNGSIPILLVGNKIDLTEHRKIPAKHGEQTANQNGMSGFMEVSAKKGTNVEQVFQNLAEMMIERTNAKIDQSDNTDQ